MQIVKLINNPALGGRPVTRPTKPSYVIARCPSDMLWCHSTIKSGRVIIAVNTRDHLIECAAARPQMDDPNYMPSDCAVHLAGSDILVLDTDEHPCRAEEAYIMADIIAANTIGGAVTLRNEDDIAVAEHLLSLASLHGDRGLACALRQALGRAGA